MNYEGLAVWSQVVASIVFLVSLVFGWMKWLAPVVVASQRRKNEEMTLAEARRDERRAEADRAQSLIGEADREAASIRARGEADASALRDRILGEARAESERLARMADGELERARAAATESLRRDLLERALEIARDAAMQLDGATNDRLVDETMNAAERGKR